MADKLINADVLLKVLDEEMEDILKEEPGFSTAIKANILVGFAKQVINDAPAVDAEPVRHGTWKEKKPQWYCSACEKMLYISVKRPSFNYCPFCGAKMDEEEEDGNESKSV